MNNTYLVYRCWFFYIYILGDDNLSLLDAVLIPYTVLIPYADEFQEYYSDSNVLKSLHLIKTFQMTS